MEPLRFEEGGLKSLFKAFNRSWRAWALQVPFEGVVSNQYLVPDDFLKALIDPEIPSPKRRGRLV